MVRSREAIRIMATAIGGFGAGGIMIADLSSAPAQADIYGYAKVDRLCITGIDRAGIIPADIAAQMEAIPPGSDIEAAIALTGSRAYCGIGAKSVATPEGSEWGDAFILAVAESSDVLVITVNEFGVILKVERWNAAPTQVDRLRQQSTDIAQKINDAEPDRTQLPYERHDLSSHPVTAPAVQTQSTCNN